MSRTRVLFVHHRPQASGAARSLALLIGALGPDWEPHVLVPDGAAAELFRRSGAVVHEGPVPAFAHTWDVQYHGLRWLVAAREAAWMPQHCRQLRRLIRQLQPDIVHLNDVVMLVSAASAARAGVPVAWHLRSSLPNGGSDRRSRWIARVIDCYASAVIAIDEDVAASYPLRTQIDVVNNPVSVADVPPAQLAIPEGRIAVGFFGYLRRQKGWPQLVEAAAILRDHEVPVHVVVVGGGVRGSAAFRGPRGRLLKRVGVTNEEAELRASVRASGLDDRFTFLPFVDEPGAVYKALDVVVFPNQGVGLGRPVLEAAAYGVAVVASGSPDGGGVLIPGATGILLSRGDAESLAAGIRELALDPLLRRRLAGEAARHAVVFAPETVAERLTAVYAAMSGRTR